MKKILISVLAVFAFVATASAQIHYGVRAGYQLNNQTYSVKGADIGLQTGFNHGFYVGGQVEYEILPGLSIMGTLQFDKSGGYLKADGAKVMEAMTNFNNEAREMHEKNNPDERIPKLKPLSTKAGGELISEEDGPDMGDIMKMLSTSKGHAAVDRYNVALPISFKYQSGPLAILAGVNLGFMVASNINPYASVNNGATTIDKDMINERIGFNLLDTYGELYGYDKVEARFENNDPMTLTEFYNKVIAQRFTLGIHAGAEYYFTKNIGVQVLYTRGLLNNIKKPLNELVKGGDQAFQFGLIYKIK